MLPEAIVKGIARSKIIKPYDSSQTPAWDDRTTENQKECIRLLRDVKRRTNYIWVLEASLKIPPGSGIPKKWPTRVYPYTFASEDDALTFLALAPEFDKWDPDVKSICAMKYRVNKTPLKERKARNTCLTKTMRGKVKQ
jgi:hypothetical protein